MLDKLTEYVTTYNPLFGNFLLSKVPTWYLNFVASIKVKETIHHARQTIAYPQLLERNKKYSRLEDYPVIDKKSYIKHFCLKDRLQVDASKLFLIERSSGSSGEPTYWPRYKGQDKYLSKSAYLLFENIFNINTKSTLLINSFALGTWTGGIRLSRAIFGIIERSDSKICLVNTGANVSEIIKILQDFSSDFDQVILAGYPPFVKRVIDSLEKNDINIANINFNLITGGEGFSEEWRDYIYKKLNIDRDNFNSGKLISTYGLADTGSGGTENALTHVIRDELRKNNLLKNELLGVDESVIPSIFQNNPIETYIESVNSELVYTIDTASPLVRYNTHDRGFVLPFDEVIKKCNKVGFDVLRKVKSITPINYKVYRLPFTFLFGRTDGLIILNGGNIYEENIRTIIAEKEFADYLTGNFRIFVTQDEEQNPVFNLYIETNYQINESKKNNFIKQFVKYLGKINNEYFHMLSYLGEKAYPVVKFFMESDKKSPLYKTDSQIKNKYVRN